jgi:hypothetical protein
VQSLRYLCTPGKSRTMIGRLLMPAAAARLTGENV